MGQNDEYFSSTPRGDVIHDLVVFEDVQIIYDRQEKIFADFFIDPKFKASTRDWIGVYPSGWSTFESFVAYKWGIGDRINNSLRHRRVVFEPIDFSNIEADRHFQFVYVGQDLEVMGVSQFFRFSSEPEEEVSKCSYKTASEDLSDQMLLHLVCDAEPAEKNHTNVLEDFKVNSKKNIIEEIDGLLELKQKLESYERKNSELEARVKNLENDLESLKSSKSLETNILNFIRNLRLKNSINCQGDSRYSAEKYDEVGQLNRNVAVRTIVGDKEMIGLNKNIYRTEFSQHKFYQSLPQILCSFKLVNSEEVPEACRNAEENN